MAGPKAGAGVLPAHAILVTTPSPALQWFINKALGPGTVVSIVSLEAEFLAGTAVS